MKGGKKTTQSKRAKNEIKQQLFWTGGIVVYTMVIKSWPCASLSKKWGMRVVVMLFHKKYSKQNTLVYFAKSSKKKIYEEEKSNRVSIILSIRFGYELY